MLGPVLMTLSQKWYEQAPSCLEEGRHDGEDLEAKPFDKWFRDMYQMEQIHFSLAPVSNGFKQWERDFTKTLDTDWQ